MIDSKRGVVRAALDGLYLAAGILAGGFLIAIFLLMMALSLGRQFGMNVPAGDDFAAWCMAAMAFLGLAHTFKRGEMIRVGLLLERLRGRTRQAAEITALGVAVIAIGFFAYQAARMAQDSWRFDDMSQGVVAVPLWFPQLGFAAGLVILLAAILDEFVHVLRGNKPTFEKEPARTPDEFVERIAQGGNL